MRIATLLASSAVAVSSGAAAQTQQSSGSSQDVSAKAGSAMPLADQTTTHVDEDQQADGAAAPAGRGLGDIVVTAQRRVESSQRAAVAIDVVSGANLAAAGATQIDRLAEQVPALTIEPTATGNLIFLRGVGNFTLTPNSDPAIALNYDGVYVGRPTGSNGLFFDLERVEVLKGPQGTLYGRNATGGAINVIPVQPRYGELSGYGTFSYGNYNSVIAEGAINIPLGEDGAARISADRASHDGYLRDGTDDQDQYSLRAQLKAKLTPNLTVRVASDYAQVRGVGTSVSYEGVYVYNPATASYLFRPSPTDVAEGLLTPAAQAFRTTITAAPAGRPLAPFDFYPFQHDNFYGANGQIDWNVGFGTLTVIPAWRYSNEDYLSSSGALAYRQRQKTEQFSVETRLVGNRIGIFDYQAGFYLYHENIAVRTALSIASSANFLNNGYSTHSIAPFGRLTANLTDRLRLTGGIRYTDDKKQFGGTTQGDTIVCLVRVNGVPSCPTVPLFGAVDNPAATAIPLPPPNTTAPILVNGVATGAVLVRSDRLDDSRLNNSKITYRGAAEFDLLPHSLLYASVETGYRSGGFNPATGFETFQPETITAYTVGLKNRFLENRVQLNLEAFWWDYRNQQVSAVLLDLSGRTANITQNIGSSRIRGVEGEGRVLVTKNLLLSADVQYLDAVNRDFVYRQANTGTPPLVGCNYALDTTSNLYVINCDGLPAFNSPKWTVNLGTQQTIPLGRYNIVVEGDTQYRTSRFIGFSYLPQLLRPSVWRSNAQLSFGPSSEAWSVAGFVRNIEGHRTVVFSGPTPLNNADTSGTLAPRTYGARVSMKF